MSHPIIWNVKPEIFSLGFLTLRWYGLLFASSFLISHSIVLKLWARDKIPTEQVDRLLVYMVVGTVVGARLGHCLFYEPEIYLADPLRILAIWEGGLASHGAAVGILFSAWLYSRRVPPLGFLQLMDRLVIPVSFACGMIRLGNLFNSEILGKPSDVPWAFVFPRVDQVARHPTQIYEFLAYTGIGFFLYRLFYRDSVRNRPGRIFGAFLILAFLARLILEFFKENQVAFESQLPMDLGQLLSLPGIAFGIYFLLRPNRSQAVKL